MRGMGQQIISYCVIAVVAILGVVMVAGITSLDWSNDKRPLVIFAPRGR